MSVQTYLRDKMLGWKLCQPADRPEYLRRGVAVLSLQEGMEVTHKIVEITVRHKIDKHVLIAMNDLDVMIFLRSPGGPLPNYYHEIAKQINDVVPYEFSKLPSN